MKSKIFRLLSTLFVVIILIAGTFSVNAETTARAADEIYNLIEDITEYNLKKSGINSVQDWINGELSRNAGQSGEWYIIALSQNGNYNFSKYETALVKYLSNNDVSSASSRLKFALTLISIGSDNSYIYNTVNNSIGKQGVISWIFGLHILNNGYSSNSYSVSSIKEKLLALQLSDGGWSVMGKYGDVDATAMAVQALSPYYKNDAKIKSAIDKALSFLSEKQQKTGDYASYGVNNPESTAQVLIALSTLGIDAQTDMRFIKNGNTVFDGIDLYRLSDGSFSHKQGGSYNSTATVQVFCSLVSYNRMLKGKTGFYILDGRAPDKLNITDNSTENPSSEKSETSAVNSSSKQTEKASNTSASGEKGGNRESSTDNTNESVLVKAEQGNSEKTDISDNKDEENSAIYDKTSDDEKEKSIKNNQNITAKNIYSNYKFWVCLAIIVAAGGTCACLFIFKKRNITNYIVIGVFAICGILLTVFTNFQSVNQHYEDVSQKNNPTGTVTISITCDAIENRTADHIPDDGIILSPAKVEIEEGDTAYDVLCNAVKKHKIHLETAGSSGGVYIKGIANIYEFDFGDLSGWMYFINGEVPQVSCSEYIISDGENLEWKYTCNLGEDLK